MIPRVRAGFAIGLVAAVASGGGVAATAGAARAQTIQASKPHTWVVGTPAGARTERVDAARTGLARTPLPASGLRVEWRVPTGAPTDQAPLVDARGVTYVVGTRGEVVAIGRDGTERWRVPTGGLDPGPAALLTDDTVVFVDGSGDAVAVREGGVRWRSRFGRPGPDGALPPAPLPLDDGGVIVATPRDLAMLDAEGHERARTVLPEPTTTPLLSALGRVVAVARTGAIWTWLPGAPEPSRVSSFGSPIEGSAVLADDHTLVAVVAGGTTFASVDLLRGALVTRAVAPGGVWLGPPVMHGEIATLAMRAPTSETAITLDASGREIGRAMLASHPALPRLDGGSPLPNAAGVPAALLVDRAGTLAFATLAGNVGVVSAGAVEILADACPRSLGAPPEAAPVAGLAPLRPASFVVACRSGSLVAVAGERATF